MIDVTLHFDLFNHLPHLLAQTDIPVTQDNVDNCLNAVFTPDSTALSCGNMMSRRAAEAWNTIWEEKIGTASAEFVAVENISVYIVTPAIGMWAISTLKSLRDSFSKLDWMEMLIMASLVSVLYLNNGLVIRNMIMASRALINWNNEQILLVTNQASRFESKLEELSDFGLVENTIVQYREQCNGLTNNQDMFECLSRAEALADKAIDDYLQRHPQGPFVAKLQQFSKNLIKDPKEFVGGVIGEAGAVGAGALVAGPAGAAVVGGVILIGKVANAASGLIAEHTLAFAATFFQHLVETGWLFSSIIAPIPVALGFYRGTRSVLIGWAISFFSLGLFKINLNIASSLIVSMIYERGPSESSFDLALMALGAPILALGMTSGGALAIFAGITSGLSALTLGIIQLSVPATTK
ncbi:MAG: hypothetical protein AAGL17_06525 [Cyanobacteria bacterium J06576_12]